MTTKSCPVKGISADAEGRFTGRAAVYGNVDSYKDIVVRGAFTKTIAKNGGRIKVLWRHDAANVIGMATLADRADGLWVTGQLELDLGDGRDAYTRIRKGLVDGISIGYKTVREGYDRKTGARLLEEVDLYEVSLVTFPANDAARVTDVKDGSASELFALAAQLRAFREVEQAKVVLNAVRRIRARIFDLSH